VAEIGLQDLNDLHKAVETLERFGVQIAYPLDGGVYIRPESMAQVFRLMCQQPKITPHLFGPRYWRASLRVGDLELYSLLLPEELPMIGYPVQELPTPAAATS